MVLCAVGTRQHATGLSMVERILTVTRTVPTAQSTMLCGGIGCFGKPRRLPRISRGSAPTSRGHVNDRAAGEVYRFDLRIGIPDTVHEAVDTPNHVSDGK